MIDNCGKTYAGQKATNLLAHIRSCHSTVYAEHFEKLKKDEKYYRIKRIKFIQSCTELIALNNRPFSLLYDSGFQKLNQDIIEELAESGNGINLNDKNCTVFKDYIENLAPKVVKYITDELHDRYLALMTDITTKKYRSILGVSVQYIFNGSIEIRSIGMVLMQKAHTAEYILLKIKECLKRHNIKLSQIIAVTTDNGSNMLAMSDIINDPAYDDHVYDDIDDNIDPVLEQNENQEQIDIGADLQIEGDISDEILLNMIQHFENIADDESDQMPNELNSENNEEALLQQAARMINNLSRIIIGIRCAVHTLQLGVKDALNISNIKILIDFCRAIVIKLRVRSYIYKIREVEPDFAVPRLDCDTRWNFTYIMVNNFLFVKKGRMVFIYFLPIFLLSLPLT